eukprot:Protomagalhaensia_wolfi_Nauph_80__5429@NODE_592_length_2236_cov_43_613564_g443_i0_p2_GENE_NODE_592_length_2236_cov_43_613564_g443_i0NODE_592_length_2236_cov_43_613564_g443_i0_p2_ORF_typecomplete_len206_score30_27LOR/PF04525_12/6_9e05Scramblase/PF03803_15/0_02Rhabdo_M2/PF04785_12/2_1Rhabdo_M2/PF04785_12/57_NODE_592_length_2236_cov_43_613564_g443_i055672
MRLSAPIIEFHRSPSAEPDDDCLYLPTKLYVRRKAFSLKGRLWFYNANGDDLYYAVGRLKFLEDVTIYNAQSVEVCRVKQEFSVSSTFYVMVQGHHVATFTKHSRCPKVVYELQIMEVSKNEVHQSWIFEPDIHGFTFNVTASDGLQVGRLSRRFWDHRKCHVIQIREDIDPVMMAASVVCLEMSSSFSQLPSQSLKQSLTDSEI